MLSIAADRSGHSTEFRDMWNQGHFGRAAAVVSFPGPAQIKRRIRDLRGLPASSRPHRFPGGAAGDDKKGNPQGAAAALSRFLCRRLGGCRSDHGPDAPRHLRLRSDLRSFIGRRSRRAIAPPQHPEAARRRHLPPVAPGNRRVLFRLLLGPGIRHCTAFGAACRQALFGTGPVLRRQGISDQADPRAALARDLDLCAASSNSTS